MWNVMPVALIKASTVGSIRFGGGGVAVVAISSRKTDVTKTQQA
jgi:hypothetical protein